MPETLFERMAAMGRTQFDDNPCGYVLALTTPDPRFDPKAPLTVNGFRFIPDPK